MIHRSHSDLTSLTCSHVYRRVHACVYVGICAQVHVRLLCSWLHVCAHVCTFVSCAVYHVYVCVIATTIKIQNCFVTTNFMNMDAWLHRMAVCNICTISLLMHFLGLWISPLPFWAWSISSTRWDTNSRWTNFLGICEFRKGTVSSLLPWREEEGWCSLIACEVPALCWVVSS